MNISITEDDVPEIEENNNLTPENPINNEFFIENNNNNQTINQNIDEVNKDWKEDDEILSDDDSSVHFGLWKYTNAL